MTMGDALVDVAGLSRSYAGRPVVDGVTLRLEPGEIVGLVGANGGGKTTTLRMIAGLLRPDAGGGQVLGQDVRHPGRSTTSRIGYMSQRLALYPDLSVRENLRFRADAFALARPGDRIADVAGRYGLGDILDQRFGTLSGGWARRAQFAATVLHEPPLLLLDEPTAGLDPATRRDIWQWLEQLAERGTAILISTHDLAEAERLRAIMLFHRGCVSPVMAPATLIATHGTHSLEDAVVAHARGSVP